MSDYGLITGLWRCCRSKCGYYGAYPSGFLLKARRVMGVSLDEPLLHVCSGRVADYSRPEFGITKGTPQRGFGLRDRTLDLDPALHPDYLQDAQDPLPTCPVPLCSDWQPWPGILIDRPYTEEDAAHYAPGTLPDLAVILKNAAAVIAPGRRIGVLDYISPTPTKDLELVALFGVIVGFRNRIRVFSVYERLVP